MGLTYHFKFAAPSSTRSAELAGFLREVEADAREMGFGPTIVMDGPFDTEERRQFARRLTTGLAIEDRRLKRPRLPDTACVWSHDPVNGSCRVMPEHGVILVVTDARGIECVFGFLRYPRAIRDERANEIMKIELGGGWVFSEFLKSGDPRYRKIVKRFDEAGYLVLEQDDYTSVANTPNGL